MKQHSLCQQTHLVQSYFLGLNLLLKNPTKTHENTAQKKKKNPYQINKTHTIMNILKSKKSNPNPSKFQNPMFGEITNQTINRNQNKP